MYTFASPTNHYVAICVNVLTNEAFCLNFVYPWPKDIDVLTGKKFMDKWVQANLPVDGVLITCISYENYHNLIPLATFIASKFKEEMVPLKDFMKQELNDAVNIIKGFGPELTGEGKKPQIYLKLEQSMDKVEDPELMAELKILYKQGFWPEITEEEKSNFEIMDDIDRSVTLPKPWPREELENENEEDE